MGEVRQGASAAAVTLLYSAAKFKALFSAYDRVDMTSLFDLPDCALEHVFGNLRAATLLTVLALVNKRCWSIVRSQVHDCDQRFAAHALARRFGRRRRRQRRRPSAAAGSSCRPTLASQPCPRCSGWTAFHLCC